MRVPSGAPRNQPGSGAGNGRNPRTMRLPRPVVAGVAPETPDIVVSGNAERGGNSVPAETPQEAEEDAGTAGPGSEEGSAGTGKEIAARTAVVAPFEPDMRPPAGFDKDVARPPTPLGWRKKATTLVAVISVIGTAVGVTFLKSPQASDPYAGPPRAETQRATSPGRLASFPTVVFRAGPPGDTAAGIRSQLALRPTGVIDAGTRRRHAPR